MKNIIKGRFTACLFYPITIYAQNEIDALRYSQSMFGSTARSFSMGGAFGALGADYSSMSSNPAGLGVYRRSEFSFSMGFANRNTDSDFLNRQRDENRFSFDLHRKRQTRVDVAEMGRYGFAFLGKSHDVPQP